MNDWQGKPEYWEKTCLSAASCNIHAIWLDRGMNPDRHGTVWVQYCIDHDTSSPWQTDTRSSSHTRDCLIGSIVIHVMEFPRSISEFIRTPFMVAPMPPDNSWMRA
jgi:hypothetical protein